MQELLTELNDLFSTNNAYPMLTVSSKTPRNRLALQSKFQGQNMVGHLSLPSTVLPITSADSIETPSTPHV